MIRWCILGMSWWLGGILYLNASIAQTPASSPATDASVAERYAEALALENTGFEELLALTESIVAAEYRGLNDSQRVKVDYLQGLGHMRLGDSKAALPWLKQSLAAALALPVCPRAQLTRIQLVLATAYKELAQYPEALQHLNEAYRRAEEAEDLPNQAFLLNAMGTTLNRQEKFDQALEVLHAAKTLKASMGDTTSMINTLGNLSIAHKRLAQYDSALYYLDQVVRLSQAIGSHQQWLIAQNNMASLLLTQEKWQQVLDLLLPLDTAAYLRTDPSLAQRMKFNTAQAWQELGQVEKAARTYEENYAWAKNSSELTFLQEVLSTYASLLAQQGNHRRAYDLQREYQDLSDSLNQKELQRMIVEQETVLKVTRQESENRRLKEGNLLQDQLLQQQKRLNYGLVIAMGVIGALLIALLFIGVRLRQNLQREKAQGTYIRQQAESLTQAHEELRQTNQALLNKVDEHQDLLRQHSLLNSHQVRGPLANLLGLIALIDLKKYHGEDRTYLQMMEESIKYLEKSVQQVNELLQRGEEEEH